MRCSGEQFTDTQTRCQSWTQPQTGHVVKWTLHWGKKGAAQLLEGRGTTSGGGAAFKCKIEPYYSWEFLGWLSGLRAPAFSLLWLWLLLCGVGSIPGPGIPTYCLCGKKEKKIPQNPTTKNQKNKREPEINIATLIKNK